jgi:hypothetical protein
MTHYRASPGLAVASCGERGLSLKFNIRRKMVDCPTCIERRDAGTERVMARFERANALKAARR